VVLGGDKSLGPHARSTMPGNSGRKSGSACRILRWAGGPTHTPRRPLRSDISWTNTSCARFYLTQIVSPSLS
jgi:hypothetical protein